MYTLEHSLNARPSGEENVISVYIRIWYLLYYYCLYCSVGDVFVEHNVGVCVRAHVFRWSKPIFPTDQFYVLCGIS